MKKNRSSNIELLRIVAMLMIVTLHLLGNDHGNVLSKTEPFSLAWTVTWWLEALCTAAVNCFVLITGYFGAGTRDEGDFDADGRAVKSRFKKILRLCVTVWFYHWIGFITAVGLHRCPPDRSTLPVAAAPILSNTYWFITTYICLCFLSPYINAMIKKLNQNAHSRLTVLSVLLFSVIPTALPMWDTFSSGGGGGIVWFTVVYIIGAYLRYYGVPARISEWKSKQWLAVYLSSSLILIFSKVFIAFATQTFIGHTVGTSLLYPYCSPVCLLESVSLFMAFLKMKTDSDSTLARAVFKISPLMFGVYIIHENPFTKSALWEAVSPEVGDNVLVLLIKIITAVSAILIGCSAIEWLRQLLFGRTLQLLRRTGDQ